MLKVGVGKEERAKETENSTSEVERNPKTVVTCRSMNV